MSNSVRPHRRQPTRLARPWDSPGKNTGVGCHFFLQCMKVKSESEVAQSCLILSDPMDCSLPGSSIHGIFQARVLEWVAIAFSVKRYYLMLKQGLSLANPTVRSSYTRSKYCWKLTKNQFYSNLSQFFKIMPYATIWMNLEIIILSEVSQKEKDKYHMISLTCGI